MLIRRFAPQWVRRRTTAASLPSWRKRSEDLFKAHRDHYMRFVEEQLARKVESGAVVRIEQPDEDAIPLDLRYEWAARRFCFNEPYKDMATADHSPDTIRQAVKKILVGAQTEKRKRANKA